ncbi:hypothetical protein FACS189418_2790 [Clostridia bacterium]|nr:hypothetical protein FACS189418_2790 [Clostridia bacterium]
MEKRRKKSWTKRFWNCLPYVAFITMVVVMGLTLGKNKLAENTPITMKNSTLVEESVAFNLEQWDFSHSTVTQSVSQSVSENQLFDLEQWDVSHSVATQSIPQSAPANQLNEKKFQDVGEDIDLQSSAELVEFTGRVEHIFFHPLIYDPEVAFKRKDAKDLDSWMVTVSEYKKMLNSIYQKDFILVHLSDIYQEQESNGSRKMLRKKLMLPKGKKPLVISYDDVNYYQYMRESGIVHKIILGEDQEIWDYSIDQQGRIQISKERDVITILNEFVKTHPDFSWKGAKGTIGLTGFEGILGYHTFGDSPNRQSEIESVRPIIHQLKATGWDFASHTFGHPNLVNISLEKLKSDADRWQSEVEPLIGSTNILLYPYGADPQNDRQKMEYLIGKNFRLFCSVGKESYVDMNNRFSVIFMDRRHPDGTTLRNHREEYLDLYDAVEVMDPLRSLVTSYSNAP